MEKSGKYTNLDHVYEFELGPDGRLAVAPERYLHYGVEIARQVVGVPGELYLGWVAVVNGAGGEEDLLLGGGWCLCEIINREPINSWVCIMLFVVVTLYQITPKVQKI